jgi:sugar/nucleoside kinase (ribokinase family)
MTLLVTSGYLTLDDLVLCDGRVLRDVLGGGALFSAVGALAWGASVGIHACTGGDYPPRYLERVADSGIDLSGVTAGPDRSLRLWLLEEGALRKQQLPKLTSATVDEMDANRGPLPTACHHAAGFHVTTSLPATQRRLASEMRRLAPQAVISLDIWTESFFDPAPYRDPAFYTGIDAFLPSDKEVEALWGLDDLAGTMRMLASYGPRTVAIKRGALGSLVYDHARTMLWEIPALPIQAVDTIGAGDAYCGGFLAGLVETGDPLEAAQRGTVSASFAIEDYGAQAGMSPDPVEVACRLAAVRALVRQVG